MNQDQVRFVDLAEFGCLACQMRGIENEPADVHHILDGGRRQSHQHTVALCPWHHRGVAKRGMTAAQMSQEIGPSMALSPAAFEFAFGPQHVLLMFQNVLLRELQKRKV